MAALIQGKPEQAMPAGLRRLRWMLLGDLPDYLAEADATRDGATLERLDPSGVGLDEVRIVWDRMAEAYVPIAAVDPIVPRAWSKSVLRATNDDQPSVDKRLAKMQYWANFLLPELVEEAEQ